MKTALTVYDHYLKSEETERGRPWRAKLIVQNLTGIWLMLALAFHLAAVGIIGLSVIIILTAFNGIAEEHQLGHAFSEALPFTALLVDDFVKSPDAALSWQPSWLQHARSTLLYGFARAVPVSFLQSRQK